jgi:hypothetical protein
MQHATHAQLSFRVQCTPQQGSGLCSTLLDLVATCRVAFGPGLLDQAQVPEHQHTCQGGAEVYTQTYHALLIASSDSCSRRSSEVGCLDGTWYRVVGLLCGQPQHNSAAWCVECVGQPAGCGSNMRAVANEKDF